MKTMKRAGILSVAAAMTLSLGLAGCSDSSSEDASSDANGTVDEITIALVPSSNASDIMGDSEPMTAWLTEELGITVSAVVTQDYTGAVEAIGSNQAQIAFLPAMPMAQAVEERNAQPLLQVVRYGSSTYHTEYITNDPDTYCEDEVVTDEDGMSWCNGTAEAETGPVALDALTSIDSDTQIAFVEESSSSGYIYPMLDLLNQGFSEDDVNAMFAGSHDGSVLAVYNDQAAVGTVFDDARGTIEDIDDVGEKVVVFAFSEEIPNDGVVASADLDADTAQQVADALTAYVATEEGAEVLDSLYEITEFAPADTEALSVVTDAAEQVLGGYSDE